MFKHKSIQMKLVNDKKAHKDHTVENHYYYPNIKEVRSAVVALGALYAIKVAVDTSAKIALDAFAQ